MNPEPASVRKGFPLNSCEADAVPALVGAEVRNLTELGALKVEFFDIHLDKPLFVDTGEPGHQHIGRRLLSEMHPLAVPRNEMSVIDIEYSRRSVFTKPRQICVHAVDGEIHIPAGAVLDDKEPVPVTEALVFFVSDVIPDAISVPGCRHRIGFCEKAGTFRASRTFLRAPRCR